MRTRLPGKTKITVCDKCLRASCWHGDFYCDGALEAGTTKKTVDELDKLNLEHASNYSKETIEAATGRKFK